MGDLSVCRGCLSTDVVLLDMNENNLLESFAIASGLNISPQDEYPHSICVYCREQLRKSAQFRTRCVEAHNVMSTLLKQVNQLTLHLIKQVDREGKKLTVPLSIKSLDSISWSQNAPVKLETDVDCATRISFVDIDPKSEYIEGDRKDEDSLFDSYKSESAGSDGDSDDTPLASIAAERKSTERKLTEGKSTERKRQGVKEKKAGAAARALRDAVLRHVHVEQLSTQQQLDEVTARRQSQNYLCAAHRCDLCYKGFLQERTYKNHMALHDPASGTFECAICRVRCASRAKLRAHSHVAHARKYVCVVCRFESHTFYQATLHYKWHNGVTYDCEKCGRSYKNSSTYFTHVRTHHRSAHECGACGDSFVSAVGLAAHRRRSHRGQVCASLPACSACGLRFRSAAALRRHGEVATRHTGVGDLHHHCRECGESFKMKLQLKNHLKSDHKDSPDVIKCKECSAVFLHRIQLSHHHRSTHLQQQAPGGPPGGPQGARGAAERRFVCEVCGVRCRSRALLSYHQRGHTGEKPHACSYCSKTFTSGTNMLIHERIHTGEKPYKCASCPKSFRYKAGLNRHNRVHTGEKPYACSYCGKCFSQSNSMKLHVATVHHKLPAPYKHKHRAKQST